MSPDGYKGKITVYGDQGTLSAGMREALEGAATEGVEIVYAEGTVPASPAVVDIWPLGVEFREPIRIPISATRRKSYDDRAKTNQPWYAKFQKNKRR